MREIQFHSSFDPFYGHYIVNFKHNSFLMFLLLTLSMYLFGGTLIFHLQFVNLSFHVNGVECFADIYWSSNLNASIDLTKFI